MASASHGVQGLCMVPAKSIVWPVVPVLSRGAAVQHRRGDGPQMVLDLC